MSWVAIERAVRMNRARGLPGDLVRWLAERDRIYNQIWQKGYSQQRGAFVQHYGSNTLDASLLLMPLVLFIAPQDPHWCSTLEAIGEELVSTRSSTATTSRPRPTACAARRARSPCARSGTWRRSRGRGRVAEARLAFEKMLTYANHLGLYAEEIGPTGEQLGNFPQAFTHLALISAAYNLDPPPWVVSRREGGSQCV